MCPAGIATTHPASAVLTEWSKMGCPTRTGKPWTKSEMWEAVERGPHQSSLSPEAIAHFAEESAEKVRVGQAKLVLLDDIKDNPPPSLTSQKHFGQSSTSLSVSAYGQGASSPPSMTQPSSWLLRAHWINWGTLLAVLYMPLPRRRRTTRYLWQNGT